MARKNQIKSITKAIWWSVVATGVLSILFGLLAVFLPGLTLATLVTLFGMFVIVMGMVWFAEAVSAMKHSPLWWLGMLMSIVAVALGIYLFMNPATTIVVFVVLLAVFIFAQSLLDLVTASYAKKGERWPWAVVGILGVVFGIAVLMHPKGASLAFVWVLGVYMLVRGILALIYAMRAKAIVKKALPSKRKTGKKK